MVNTPVSDHERLLGEIWPKLLSLNGGEATSVNFKPDFSITINEEVFFVLSETDFVCLQAGKMTNKKISSRENRIPIVLIFFFI